MSTRVPVAVVGLGYVGLPLALAFGRVRPVIGFDLNETKLATYREGRDPTGEMPEEAFARAGGNITWTNDPKLLAKARYIVVAVPTPIDEAKRPDLGPLAAACETVGRHMAQGAIVVFESTVYPGCTEEFCVPILTRASGMQAGRDFRVGYSPERVNPGDKEHTLERIVKVVSGQDEETLEEVAALYAEVIEVGVHRAPSIKVAEAAKVIENTQRDLNIALMNELALIFHRMGVDTLDVLEAAGTKWNFLPFRPGLVGGHCIGVDPYYLTHKAQILGHHPEVILAGRRINDGMGKFVAEQAVKEMIRAGKKIAGARVLVLGLTFKENVADIRNTRVVDVLRELEDYGCEVLVWDPVADAEEARREYGIGLLSSPEEAAPVDAVVAAVAHEEVRALAPEDVASWVRAPGVLVDVKGVFDRGAVRRAGLRPWRL